MESSCVPPGFRFHPTEEELVGYYLNRKVNDLKIDLDVITDIDLYRMEPWDIQDRCKLGYEEQSEWYFFSHKDRKYPTGTRTNRATAAGFWKATGRDKAVLSKEKLIGMRKTLVFYRGRAPNGRKTDWIMHEYRLQAYQHGPPQEEGWVVCRAFKKPSPSHHQKQGFEAWTSSSDAYSYNNNYIRSENANFRPPPSIYNRQTTMNIIESTNFQQNPYASDHHHQHHQDFIMTISNQQQTSFNNIVNDHLPELDDSPSISTSFVTKEAPGCFEHISTSICSSDQDDKTSINDNNNNYFPHQLFNNDGDDEEWKLLVPQVHVIEPSSFACQISQPLLPARDHDELLLGCFNTAEL